MNTITVDISDLKVSDDPEAMLITYALGSCIAVMVHDPVRVAAGMIHYMLPLSETAPAKARARPAMFGDTGIPLLLQELSGMGCDRKNLIVKVAGGGALSGDNGLFTIGTRNYTVLRKLFSKAGMTVAAEDVGGARSRTARLQVGSGRCTIVSRGEEVEL
jgi:chemotaxis protein CheD